MHQQETGIPLKGQKLIYKGEVLQTGSVETCGISDDDFLVVVVARSPDEVSEVKEVDKKKSSYNSEQEKAEATRAREKALASVRNDSNQAGNFPVQLTELIQALATFSVAGQQFQVQVDPRYEEESRDREEVRQEEEEEEEEEEEGDGEDEHDLDGENCEEDEEEEDEEEEDEEDGEGMLFEDNESLQQLLDMGVDEPMSEDELRSLARSRREQEVNGPTNEEAVTRLREMGFSEEDVTHALRACDNNFEAAMAWLLGDREGGGMEEEEEDEEEDEEEQEEEEGGIDMRGSNLNPAFLDSTEMRQILSNPRVVMQLQEMLSDPESMRNHLNNPEMLQILQAFNNHNLQYRPDDNEPA
ncbi:hypothetical protein GUITHDRAFT_106921 [Guillardia theta CCMP2712]|uniref:UV excision repair protein RAD23 n=1 Tax=Guillardia theta (strain CCMP2712) TaxID=905079 RepID=L1JG37_GUITC|nr:hypothetical protein GUITHDRAFT_106921 [Guillardia theta CCMP2712]EKX47483.1 hypothetical protein GUITHDRAFT_106921 [Guillardia theta CCMP2712]|eukprot:XP_005834463.1 hypothetical protein GUITHDRAFT_106921 [Guillardia theta CCMP2712]